MVFFLMDAAVVVAAFGIAEVVSLRDRAPADYWPKFLLFLLITLIVQLTANRVFGLYGRIWRHAGVEEARNIAMACLVTLAVLLALYPIGFEMHLTRVPLQVIPLGCALTLLGIGLLRFHSRLLGWQRANRGMGIRVAVVGSKDAGAAVIRGMLRNPGGGMFPVAVIDDDERTHGLSLMGVPVVGSIDDLPAAIEKLQIQQVLLAIPNPTTSVVERCVRASEDAEIVMKIVPDLTDIMSSIAEPSVSIRSAREPRIEDLLGRREAVTDLAAVRNALDGRRVLVTGAGGSIGSEICRQVSGFGPDVLVMLDHDETHLHEASATTSPNCKVEQVLADVSNRQAVMDAFSRWQPDVVFHAAAHKHVPILETHVVEAVTTNVLGTRNVLDAATTVGTERFVFVSTDKAVRPSSVMGATKRMGERLLLDRAPAGCSLLRRPLRERPGQPGQRDPDLPAPDRCRWSGDRDRPPHDPLLHERGGGGAAGSPILRPGRGRRHLHARDGRARLDPGPGTPDDPALRAPARARHSDPDHGAPDRREAARAVAHLCGGPSPDVAPLDPSPHLPPDRHLGEIQ